MDQQKLLPIARALETRIGYRPHPTTVWRWCVKGAGGVRLKTVMVGGRRMAKPVWIDDFIERKTKQTTPAEVSAELDRELSQ